MQAAVRGLQLTLPAWRIAAPYRDRRRTGSFPSHCSQSHFGLDQIIRLQETLELNQAAASSSDIR